MALLARRMTQRAVAVVVVLNGLLCHLRRGGFVGWDACCNVIGACAIVATAGAERDELLALCAVAVVVWWTSNQPPLRDHPARTLLHVAGVQLPTAIALARWSGP